MFKIINTYQWINWMKYYLSLLHFQTCQHPSLSEPGSVINGQPASYFSITFLCMYHVSIISDERNRNKPMIWSDVRCVSCKLLPLSLSAGWWSREWYRRSCILESGFNLFSEEFLKIHYHSSSSNLDRKNGWGGCESDFVINWNGFRDYRRKFLFHPSADTVHRDSLCTSSSPSFSFLLVFLILPLPLLLIPLSHVRVCGTPTACSIQRIYITHLFVVNKDVSRLEVSKIEINC